MAQTRKDSDEKRVNFDNTREDKFQNDTKGDKMYGKENQTQKGSQNGNNSGKKQGGAKKGKRSNKNSRSRNGGSKGNGVPNNASAIRNRYARNPQMLAAASSYGFSYITGQKLPYEYSNSTGTTTFNQVVPGILTLGWEPAFGGDNIIALDQALNSIYSFVVHANSRNMDKYNAMDQGCFIIAGMNFFSYLESLKRVYGYMRWVTERNTYAPAYVIEALGFDYLDLQKNLSNMWFDINYLVTLSKQIWIPNVMPVLMRWIEMNQVIYTDGSSIKSQMYAYVPARLYMVDESILNTGTCLRPVNYGDVSVGGSETDLVDFTHNPENQVASAPYTWADAMAIATTMLNALIQSDSRGLIYGDILKAYGPEAIYAAAEIDSSYMLAPLYSPDVMMRIENTIVMPQYPMVLTQNQITSTLEPVTLIAAQDTAKYDNYVYPENIVLNMHTEVVAPEAVLFATEHAIAGNTFSAVRPFKYTISNRRLQMELQNDTIKVSRPSSSGTEVITSMCIFSKAHAVGAPSYTRFSSIFEEFNGHRKYLADYMAFDWAPWLYSYNSENDIVSGLTWMPGLAIGDFDNFTILTPQDVLKLHTAVVYDAFGVPVAMR